MALIEHLAYASEVELMHDCPTSTRIPDHVVRIGSTAPVPTVVTSLRRSAIK